MEAAVARSGADALMMTRLLGIDTRTNVSTVMVPGPMLGPGFGPGSGPRPGWWGGYSGWYAVPQVTQYQVATAETTVFDVKTHRSSGRRHRRRSIRAASSRRRRASPTR